MSEVTTAEQLQTAQAAWRQLLPGQLRVLEDIQGSRELYLSPTNLKNNIAIGHTMAKTLPTPDSLASTLMVSNWIAKAAISWKCAR